MEYFLSLTTTASNLPLEVQLIILTLKGDPMRLRQEECKHRLCKDINSKRNTIELIRFFSGVRFTIVRPPLLEFCWCFLKYGNNLLLLPRFTNLNYLF